jgi:hypothetical protein
VHRNRTFVPAAGAARYARRVRSLIKVMSLCFFALLSAGLTVAALLSWAAIGTCENDCAGDATFTLVKVLFFVGAAGCLGSVITGAGWIARRLRSRRRSIDR